MALVTPSREHYDRLLGSVYGWMLGDLTSAIDGAHVELESVGLPVCANGAAIDLGAGTGVHAVALADMGFDVVALDSCAVLLDELRDNAGERAVKPVLGDLCSFPSLCSAPVDVIVCMGDTLTHLESLSAVEQLFGDVASALVPGGVFVATFRDYSATAPEGAARFIPVRSDADRILTCFLDYREKTVLVHDILHERANGSWSTTVSAYPKLRIDPHWALDALSEAGLTSALEQGARGMLRLIGRCPTKVSSGLTFATLNL